MPFLCAGFRLGTGDCPDSSRSCSAVSSFLCFLCLLIWLSFVFSMYWVKCRYFAQSSKEWPGECCISPPGLTKCHESSTRLYQQCGGNPANRPCGECIHGIYHPHLSLKSISTIPPSNQCPHISKGVSFTYSLGDFPDYCFFAGSWG